MPFAFVKSKAKLGKIVHKKTATVVALTEVRKEDQAELENLARSFKAQFNDNSELRKNWGEGTVGMKSQHAREKHQRALETEQLKKANL